jgi:hypothetical protein
MFLATLSCKLQAANSKIEEVLELKKVLIIFLAVMLALSVPASILAGPSGAAGNSNIGHLYLYQKDTSDWSIVEGGAWGKLKYNQSCFTFDYVFNGHGPG